MEFKDVRDWRSAVKVGEYANPHYHRDRRAPKMKSVA